MDSALPGFLFDYVRGILRKADCHDKFDISETVLRLGGAPESEGRLPLYIGEYDSA